jgi:hypothetical protein
VALVVIGFAARLSPLLDVEGRVFWQFMSEDGYLMQTVSRNMALGFGMSTADGTIPTNGVQPLATFLCAGLHFLAGGSKLIGIALVTVFSTLVSAGAAYCFHRVGTRVLSGLRHGRELALLTAALWFAAPGIIDHSMNGLETCVYYLAILVTLQFYLTATAEDDRALTWPQRLLLGVLLGLTFLARNDAVFLLGGLLLAHWLVGGVQAGGGPRQRLGDCLVAGLTSIAVGVPWLLNNYSLFGSIVPISGLAESHGIRFGQNLPQVPANLFAAGFLYTLIPRSVESELPALLVSAAAVVTALCGFWFVVRDRLASRRFLLAGMLFAGGLAGYYGLFFGASFFLPRYLSAVSPFFWLATTATAFVVGCLLCHQVQRMRMAAAVIVGLLAVEATLHAALDYFRGQAHNHRRVVEWVQANVPSDQWIGAVQTGTLGFFYSRTINLDGKVNPEALRARMRDGNVLDYVVDSKINYIADWAPITSWITRKNSPRFAAAFEVIVKDEQHNLGVLRRIHPVE